jgi:hypothetical protein
MNTRSKHIPVIMLSLFVFLAMTALPAMAMNETLIGAVVKTDAGVALSTASGEYLTRGKDIAPYLGMTILVNGNVDNGAMSQTVRVKEMQVLSPNDLIDPAGVPGLNGAAASAG